MQGELSEPIAGGTGKTRNVVHAGDEFLKLNEASDLTRSYRKNTNAEVKARISSGSQGV